MKLPTRSHETLAEAIIHAAVTIQLALPGDEMELRFTVAGLAQKYGESAMPQYAIPGDHYAFHDGSCLAVGSEYVCAYKAPQAPQEHVENPVKIINGRIAPRDPLDEATAELLGKIVRRGLNHSDPHVRDLAESLDQFIRAKFQ